ncbi:MAG: c-type cytochrome biogenesis protein CcmI [Oleiphilaceae bacterium]|nr:c-type cytochrome biogenesis protein CcmI [Oleiphilaceae bacterium]
MTLTFWLALVLLVALALTFVIYPLLGQGGQGAAPSRRQQNLDSYRHRLAELEQERDAGVIDDAMFGQLRQEMEANLLDDVDEQQAPSSQGSRRLMFTVSLMASVLVPVLAFVLYGQWGAEDRLVQTRLMNQLQSGEVDSATEMNTLLDRLQQELARNPDNPDGWLMLARSRMQNQQYRPAALAYEQLAQLAGEDRREDAAVAWGMAAQAHFLAADRELDEAALEAIRRARSINSAEVNATGLLGIDAFQRGEYLEAIAYWEQVLESAPPERQLDSIRSGVVAAYRRLGEPVPPSVLRGGQSSGTDRTGSAEGDGNAVIRLSVELSDQARQAVDDEDVVFVYARAQEGPPRPLAIQRLTVADLPVEIQLDPSMAMSDEDRLRAGQEVMLVARVSLSGDARPQSGDWQGEMGPMTVGESPGTQRLRVDQAVR